MASLYAASFPSTSFVGSASAYPAAIASASASSKDFPVSIREQMYVVVPLSKPRSVRGRTAPSPRIPAITGTAAATAASNRSSRFASRAAS